MTSYRLPDWLGGHPVSRIVLADSADPKVTVLVETDTTHATIGLDRDQLVEVKPPLPPEPPIGTVVLDGGDRAWQRVRDDRDPPWRHDSLMCSWETMVRDNSPLTALVPDPAADAPTLPLRINEDQTDVRIEPSDAYQDRLFVDIEYQHLRREHVRQISAAMWAWAAREVEQP